MHSQAVVSVPGLTFERDEFVGIQITTVVDPGRFTCSVMLKSKDLWSEVFATKELAEARRIEITEAIKAVDAAEHAKRRRRRECGSYASTSIPPQEEELHDAD